MTEFTLERQTAEAAARAAGALLRRAYRQPRTVSDKGDNDLVTNADLGSQALVTDVLGAAFPHYAIVGEEGTKQQGEQVSPFTWWIDPLDGTYNFVHGVPRFSVSIGLLDSAGEVVVGVVYDPMFDECFTAVKGQGALCNGEPLRVSGATTLYRALAASGFPPARAVQTVPNNLAAWSAFAVRCQGMARMGSAALDLCYVASGRFDMYWEYGLSTWDMAAGVLMVREAGGTVTDYTGQAFNVRQITGLLSSNGLLHQEALAVFKEIEGQA